jgi:hypothetical protein
MMTDAERYERERDINGSPTAHHPRAAWEAEENLSHPTGAAVGYAIVAAVTAVVFGPIGFAIGRWW